MIISFKLPVLTIGTPATQASIISLPHGSLNLLGLSIKIAFLITFSALSILPINFIFFKFSSDSFSISFFLNLYSPLVSPKILIFKFNFFSFNFCAKGINLSTPFQ